VRFAEGHQGEEDPLPRVGPVRLWGHGDAFAAEEML